MCKKLLCLFLAMLMLLASVPAFAEDDLIIDDEFEEIDDFEDEQEGEDLPVDIGSLTEYDYEHITVGNPTPLNGQFFTAMWGNSTSDIDVRKLVSAYSMISWDTSISQFRFDHSVVSGAVVLGEQDGARTYYISLYSDLCYSDGTPITAWDYAFSVLLTGSPLIAELGGVPERYDFLEGFEDYAAGKTPYISGLRVLNDYQLMFRARADAFPYFYELSRFDIEPFPIHRLAPGCEVYDDGDGAYIDGKNPMADNPFTADLLRKTILDPQDGYLIHPDPCSGPYRILSYEGETAEFEINPLFKGTENGEKPHIRRLTYTRAENETMIGDLADGKFALLNKVTFASPIQEGLQLCMERGQYTRSTYPRIGLTYILFNPEKAAFQDKLVRQAIAYCLDGQQFVRDYVGAFGLEVYGLYGLGQWMYQMVSGTMEFPAVLPENPTAADEKAYEEELAAWAELTLDDLTHYDLDVEKAAALLDQAGWTLNEQGQPFVPGSGDVRCKMIDEQLIPMKLTMAYQADARGETALDATFCEHLQEAGIHLNLIPIRFDQTVDTENILDFADLDMMYLGNNFNINFNIASFFSEGAQDDVSGENLLPAVYAEMRDLAKDMDATEPNDLLGYMVKWIAFQERLNDLLPLIPVYGNVYFDFYTRELTDYIIEEYAAWGLAIVPARMQAFFTEEEDLESLQAELSFVEGEAELDLMSLVGRHEKSAADYSDGSLSMFPADVRRQIPAEYRTINEIVTAQVSAEADKIAAATLNFRMQTLYPADETVYAIFGIPQNGSATWIVCEGRTKEDGSVSVTLQSDRLNALNGHTCIVVIVSK